MGDRTNVHVGVQARHAIENAILRIPQAHESGHTYCQTRNAFWYYMVVPW